MQFSKTSWRATIIVLVLLAVSYIAQGCQFPGLHPRAVCVAYGALSGPFISGHDDLLGAITYSLLTVYGPLVLIGVYLIWKRKEIQPALYIVFLFVLPVLLCIIYAMGITNPIRPQPNILACDPVVSKIIVYAPPTGCPDCDRQESELRESVHAAKVERVNTKTLFTGAVDNVDALPSVGWGIEFEPFGPAVRVDFVDKKAQEKCIFNPLLYRDRPLLKGDEYTVPQILSDIAKYAQENYSYSEY